jgi:hypothetical protein
LRFTVKREKVEKYFFEEQRPRWQLTRHCAPVKFLSFGARTSLHLGRNPALRNNRRLKHARPNHAIKPNAPRRKVDPTSAIA